MLLIHDVSLQSKEYSSPRLFCLQHFPVNFALAKCVNTHLSDHSNLVEQWIMNNKQISHEWEIWTVKCGKVMGNFLNGIHDALIFNNSWDEIWKFEISHK